MPTHYAGGFKWVDDRRYEPVADQKFSSRSDPNRPAYQTIIWADGVPSCNCKGWATHKTCRHVVETIIDALGGKFGRAVRDLVNHAETHATREDVVRARRESSARAARRVAQTPAASKPAASKPDKPLEPGQRRIRL